MHENIARPRDGSEFFGVRQVAELLSVSRLSVYRLVEQGLVPVYRILRCVRFKRSDIVNFLAKRRTPAWRDDPYARQED